MSTVAKKLYSFKILAAASRGMVVKYSSTDGKTLAKATAGTDKLAGILQNTTTDANEIAEVAKPGGGAMGLLADTVAAGDELTAGATGALVKVTAAHHIVIAVAEQAGVSGDLIAVEVVRHKATEAQS